jgi:hypothetical protein
MISSFTQRVRHIVLFALKPGTTPEDVVAISQAFMRLREDIPQIRNLEWGRDIRAEDRQGGHTHAFLVTFDLEGVQKVDGMHGPADAGACLTGPRIQAI